jgi:hypothetical protein
MTDNFLAELKRMQACEKAVDWVMTQKTPQEAWSNCVVPEWLGFYITAKKIRNLDTFRIGYEILYPIFNITTLPLSLDIKAEIEHNISQSVFDDSRYKEFLHKAEDIRKETGDKNLYASLLLQIVTYNGTAPVVLSLHRVKSLQGDRTDKDICDIIRKYIPNIP